MLWKFHVSMRKNFTARVTEQRRRLPRGTVEFLSLEIFKIELILATVLYGTLPTQGGWTR